MNPLDITLTTPALLFPALSLLMLAYTNRFLGLYTVIRNLHADYQKSSPILLGQIENLRYRVVLIAGEGLNEQGELTREHVRNLNPDLSLLADICGGCERIKKTPIPYSYNLFIKTFILPISSPCRSCSFMISAIGRSCSRRSCSTCWPASKSWPRKSHRTRSDCSS